MPELPEVQYYKEYIDATSLRKKIKELEVRSRKVLSGVSEKRLKRALEGKSFLETTRRGKYLFISFSPEEWFYLHFGMTGDVRYYKGAEDPKHARVLFRFSSGYSLAFVNQRLFGKVGLTRAPEIFASEKGLGPDALDLDLVSFQARMRSKRGAVKPALMDQSVLAGVGNIYSDEILFQSRIHPRQLTTELDDEDLKRLYLNLRKVLSKSVEKKTELEKLPGSWLIHSREDKAKCPRCDSRIEKVRISGRNGYFCPGCQNR